MQHREVGALVRADDARRQAAVLEQRDGDLVGVRDDVMVREDVAVRGIDDDAGACAFDLALARARRPARNRRIAAATRPAELRLSPLTLLVTEMLTTAGEIVSIIGAKRRQFAAGVLRRGGAVAPMASSSDERAKRLGRRGPCRLST